MQQLLFVSDGVGHARSRLRLTPTDAT
jgi:hypothetical protein